MTIEISAEQKARNLLNSMSLMYNCGQPNASGYMLLKSPFEMSAGELVGLANLISEKELVERKLKFCELALGNLISFYEEHEPLPHADILAELRHALSALALSNPTPPLTKLRFRVSVT